MKLLYLLGGVAVGLGSRALMPRLLVLKFSRDVTRLNEGDYRPLLDAYADDFVLHFNEGPHRWSGEWVGKQGMDVFLQMFTAAGIKGELGQIATSGPLWAMTLWARFDDHADDRHGNRIYENSTVLVLRTRWGKVVEQTDYYVDTRRIVEFDRKLAELEAEPVT